MTGDLCETCGQSLLDPTLCDCPQPVLVVVEAFMAACAKARTTELRSTSLHMALLADELLARGCTIAGVTRSKS